MFYASVSPMKKGRTRLNVRKTKFVELNVCNEMVNSNDKQLNLLL